MLLVWAQAGTACLLLYIATFLHQIGFQSNRSDVSLFVYNQDDATAYLLLYGDDIIQTALTTDLLR